MKEVYQRLKNLPQIQTLPNDRILDECKYVKLARRHQYSNYRLLLYKDLKDLGLSGSFSKFQLQFFADAGASVAIFNEMSENLISIVFRATNAKAFLNYSLHYSVYGYDMIDPDFKYGDWIVLVEGLYDADVLRQIYPNVVATQTSNVTITQAAALKEMTNHFIIAFDSDDAGASGFGKAMKRLGDGIQHLPIYPGDKDIGEMEEWLDKRNLEEYQKRYDWYKSKLDDCMNTTEIGFLL